MDKTAEEHNFIFFHVKSLLKSVSIKYLFQIYVAMTFSKSLTKVQQQMSRFFFFFEKP